MKRIVPLLMICGVATAALTNSCQDSPGDVGGALVQGSLEIMIDSSFTVKGRSIVNERIQSRTTTQLLGAIKASNYGSLRSDYFTQMLPTNQIDTVGGVTSADVDSVKLLLVFDKDGFVGDSLVPIGINVYPLNDTLPYPIYSNESAAPYYDPADKLGSVAFSAAGYNDSIAGSDYRYVYVTLPRQTGVDFFNKFVEDPALFSNPQRFAEEFCQGFYVEAAFGSGRVTRITDTRWVLYYHRTYQVKDSLGVEHDSIAPSYGIYMAAAPEMIANSHITYVPDDAVKTMTGSEGRTVLVSPAGYDVELQFPIEEVIKTYKESAGDLSVINNLTFKIPACKVENDHGIGMPVNLLMVLSRDKEEFFAQNKLPDNITSFNTVYSSADTGYVFSEMRAYLLDILSKEEIKPEDYTFTITPIALETENSSNSYYSYATEPSINAVTPLVSMPSMVELKLDKAQIKLTFSKRNLKNN